MQLLFSTGKSFTVDGLREKLPEFFRQEATAELRRRGHYWVSVVDIESDVGWGTSAQLPEFSRRCVQPRVMSLDTQRMTF